MEKKQNFWLALILGLMLGIILCLAVVTLVIWIYCTYVDSPFWDKFLSPLVTSATTLIAAAGAIFGVIRSINNQNKLYQDSQSRKLSAARSFLPLALVEIEEICISALTQLLDETKINKDTTVLISENTKDTIKLVIEYSHGQIKSDFIEFLSYYQMAISKFHRYRVESKDPELDHLHHKNTIDSIIHWAILRAISTSYLKYARNISQELDKNRVHTIFKEEIQTYREEGRYKNIDTKDFNEIFNQALNASYPSPLYPYFLWKK